MSRITETTNATLREEIVAPATHIQWDPATDTGTVIWYTAIERWVNGEYAGYKPTGDALPITIEECLTLVLDITLPDGSTKQLSGVDIFLGMKAAFDQLYPVLVARRQALENAPIAYTPLTPLTPLTPPPEAVYDPAS